MHDWLGIGLIALGIGLIFAAVAKHRSRQRIVVPAGAIRPEFASMGEIVRPLVLFCVGFVALKMSLFYFLLGGNNLLTALDFGGLMFVLAAYCGYLVAATSKRRQAAERPAEVEHVVAREPAEAKSAA